MDSELLFSHAFLLELFGKNWSADRHIKALYGWFMRRHADRAHPEAIEDIARQCTLNMTDAEREAWLFGYHYQEPVGQP